MKKLLIFLLAVVSLSASAQIPYLNDLVRNNTLSPARVANALDALKYWTASGTDTYSIAPGLGIYSGSATYADGDQFLIYFVNANTSTSVSINVNVEGAKSIVDHNGDGPSIGTLHGLVHIVYTGTNFVIAGSIGGGSSPDLYTIEEVTGGSQGLTEADNGKIFIYTNILGCTVTMDESLTEGFSFTAIRSHDSGQVDFVAGGSASLHSVNDEFSIEVEEGWASWVFTTADEWRGTGVLGPASSGGGTWGSITGTLSDQTDLQSALDAKQDDITFGTGVLTALGVNVGSAGAPVLFNGAGGTPSSMTGTNITGIPQSGVTNLTTDLAGKAPLLITEVTYTADFTLDADDIGKDILINSASPVTITLPSNATEAINTGAYWTLESIGTGDVTIVAGSGASVSRNSAGTLAGPGQNQPFIIRKVSTNGFKVWNGGPPPTGSPLTGATGIVNVSVTANNSGLQSAVFSAAINNISSLAIGDIWTASGVNTPSVISAVSANRVLMSAGTNTLPAYSTATYLPTVTAGSILHGTATNAVGQSANLTFANQLLVANGGTQFAYAAKTTTYTVTTADRFIECTSGSFTVTLPTAVSKAGFIITIDNSGAGTITLATTSSQTIDGASPGTLTAGQKITLYSNGANWRTF